MKVKIFQNSILASEYVATFAVSSLDKKSNWALPTGSTPKHFYETLCKLWSKEKELFLNLTTFNLDEYIGIPTEASCSYHSYMNDHFLDKVKIHQSNIPNGNAESLVKECSEYESKINSAGGIDISFLGIGINGHIGFNEPGSEIDSRTRVVSLHPQTKTSNSKFFKKNIPDNAISIGIGTILESKKIILMAFGKEKADIIKEVIEGNISSKIPASYLQRHPDVTIILDESAGAQLKNKREYKWNIKK